MIFNIGDIVQVVNRGKTYDTHEGKALEHGLEKWVNGGVPANGSIGIVIFCDEKESWNQEFCSIRCDNQDYILSGDGLKLVERKINSNDF